MTVGMTGARMTSLTQTAGASSRQVRFGYSSLGHLASVTNTMGGVTSFSSGGSSDTGQVVTVTNVAGSTTTLGLTGAKVAQVTQSNTAPGSPGTSTARLSYPSGTQTLVADPSTNQALAVSAVPHTTYTLTGDGALLVASAADPNGHTRAATYTSIGNLASTTPAAGGSTSYSYGANSNESLTSVAAAAGATSSASYTNTGAAQYLPSSTSNDSGESVNYTYNGAGNPMSTAQGTGPTATVTYNPDGTAAASASPGAPAGVRTSYGYNSAHQLVAMTPVTGSSLAARAYTWDPFGRLATATDGRGNTITYGYDNADRITAVAYSDPGTHGVTYGYDSLDRVTQRVDGAGTTTYTYDDLGKLTSTANTAAGGTISYTYDLAGALASETTAMGTTRYAYDPAHQLTSISYPQGSDTNLTAFANDANGRRTDTWLQTDTSHTGWAAHSHTDYDSSGRVTHVLGQNGPATGPTTVLDQTTCYAAGAVAPTCPTTSSADRTKISWVSDTVSGETTTYSYDDATGGQTGRLLRAVVTGGTNPRTYSYTYNTAGNRTGATVIGATPSNQSLAFNNANQISTAPNAYDGAGNQSASTGGTATYNTAGQTTATTTTGVSGTNTYTYAGTNQNEPLKQNTARGDIYSFIYGRTDRSGLPEIEQVNVNALTGYIIHDPSGLPVMIQTNPSVTVLYMYDGRNNPVLLSTSFSTTSFAQRFDPYGAATLTAGNTTNGAYIENPYTFGGGIQDKATGHIKFGARWYDPSTGTWTQQDTYNAPLDPTNANRYAYVGGDPINRTDPTGRDFGGCLISSLALAGTFLAFGGAVLTAPETLGGSLLIAGAALSTLSADVAVVTTC